ncbi:MAG: BACON domain-containing protein, partial [Bacteroidales bacterium]|nr:BACON domain-containing protein [Bacteroidales bacterium]
MKKIYNIILTTVVCLAGLAACTHDYPVGEMARNISVAPDAQQTAAAGQSFDVAVTADGAWVAYTPDWISVTPANGEGNATVKVTVAANEGGERTDKVQFYSAVGDVSSTAIDLESTPLAELNV